jgi:Acyl-CoA dehydrogenase, C-terminal domain
LHVLEVFCPTVGAATLGFARRAMAEAIDRGVKRTTFKKPISEHQLIQAKLADMAVGIDAAALLVYRAAWQHDATERSIAREAAIAKLYSTETAFDIIDQAVQIFGGLGLIRGTTVDEWERNDDLQALELVAIHGPHPAQEGGALIELKFGAAWRSSLPAAVTRIFCYAVMPRVASDNATRTGGHLWAIVRLLRACSRVRARLRRGQTSRKSISRMTMCWED